MTFTVERKRSGVGNVSLWMLSHVLSTRARTGLRPPRPGLKPLFDCLISMVEDAFRPSLLRQTHFFVEQVPNRACLPHPQMSRSAGNMLTSTFASCFTCFACLTDLRDARMA